MLQRVGGWVSGLRPQDTTLVRKRDLQRFQIGPFLDNKQDRKRGVVFLSFGHVCLLLVSPADIWSETAVELHCWREEGSVIF